MEKAGITKDVPRSQDESHSAYPPHSIPNGDENLQSPAKNHTLARVHFFTLCLTLFLAGWNDGTLGPLLPRIQQVYKVNYTIVSMIFIFACTGFISGSIVNIYITDRFGFGKTIVFGALCQVVAYSIQCTAPPFPVFVMAYTINGAGISLQARISSCATRIHVAQAMGFVASLRHRPEVKMSFLTSAYGVGAFIAPLVSTQFAILPRWSFYFLVSLSLALTNTTLLCLVFKFKRQDECLQEAGEILPGRPASRDGNSFGMVMRNRSAHIMALFTLVYVGVEVTIGGWSVTFIRNVRGGGQSSGYISSGFFGGLTVGRILLLWVNSKIGERLVVFIYAFLALSLEFVVWFVPSLIGDAIAVSIVGLLLGPMFPIIMNQSKHIIPRRILTASIGWISGLGQAGSALFPFITGALAEKHGIKSLQPTLIGMIVAMACLWALVPSSARRTD
ncbi:MFS general substrate transporter [Agrocybe pediades]|nr:MFS general substrate transporter [Agrocybe pediades]